MCKIGLVIDAYKWKAMAHECDDDDMKQKYMTVSDTLFDLFMKEHTAIGNMFKAE